MKQLSNDELSLITGGRKGMSDDLVCGILSTGLAMISFGLGALTALACWVIAEDIHLS